MTRWFAHLAEMWETVLCGGESVGVGSVLGFPFGEACLLGAGRSGISWGLHQLGGSLQSSCMEMLPRRWVFWISFDSLDIWVDVFLWGGGGLGLWLVSAGLLGSRSCWHVSIFGHSVGELFDCN